MLIKNNILALWSTVDRPGVSNLIEWLVESDFFEAPRSTEFHLAVPGGLALHSLNVHGLLAEKIGRYNLGKVYNDETAIICGLGHDLCKVHFYTRGTKNVKENGTWREKQIYIVKDQFPYGHGEKSVSILQDFIKLTPDEKLAIRFHMVAFDAGIHFGYPTGYAFRQAAKIPLVTLLFTADYESSQILEATMENKEHRP